MMKMVWMTTVKANWLTIPSGDNSFWNVTLRSTPSSSKVRDREISWPGNIVKTLFSSNCSSCLQSNHQIHPLNQECPLIIKVPYLYPYLNKDHFSFQLTGSSTSLAGLRADSCTSDYLIINGGTDDPTSNPTYDRWGRRLNGGYVNFLYMFSGIVEVCLAAPLPPRQSRPPRFHSMWPLALMVQKCSHLHQYQKLTRDSIFTTSKENAHRLNGY